MGAIMALSAYTSSSLRAWSRLPGSLGAHAVNARRRCPSILGLHDPRLLGPPAVSPRAAGNCRRPHLALFLFGAGGDRGDRHTRGAVLIGTLRGARFRERSRTPFPSRRRLSSAGTHGTYFIH